MRHLFNCRYLGISNTRATRKACFGGELLTLTQKSTRRNSTYKIEKARKHVFNELASRGSRLGSDRQNPDSSFLNCIQNAWRTLFTDASRNEGSGWPSGYRACLLIKLARLLARLAANIWLAIIWSLQRKAMGNHPCEKFLPGKLQWRGYPLQ